VLWTFFNHTGIIIIIFFSLFLRNVVHRMRIIRRTCIYKFIYDRCPNPRGPVARGSADDRALGESFFTIRLGPRRRTTRREETVENPFYTERVASPVQSDSSSGEKRKQKGPFGYESRVMVSRNGHYNVRQFM